MRVFSGIQPTGDKHLGNYIGAIRQYVASQDTADPVICIVDLHSITVDYDPEELRESTLSLAALLFASGLDPERCVLFAQSHNPDHPEAAWLLGSVTSFGELQRMTQFKEKAEQQQFVSVGLFTYPVLQAADIVLYDTDVVPVGEDQRQHIELTRDVAQRFNSRFGETLVRPARGGPEGRSEDHGPAGADEEDVDDRRDGAGHRAMLDPPEVIAKKVKSAVTDSGRDVRRGPGKEGIANLIEVMSVATGDDADTIEGRYDGAGYGQFKGEVAETVVELLRPIRERYDELRADPGELERLLALGAEQARAITGPVLERMYERMGFVRRPA